MMYSGDKYTEAPEVIEAMKKSASITDDRLDELKKQAQSA
jgi:hypothetical protein